MLHERDVLRCCSCTHPGVEAKLMKAKVAYLHWYRITKEVAAGSPYGKPDAILEEVVRHYIDELCVYDAIERVENSKPDAAKSQPDAAKAEFFFSAYSS
jgi:hypothetical protein